MVFYLLVTLFFVSVNVECMENKKLVVRDISFSAVTQEDLANREYKNLPIEVIYHVIQETKDIFEKKFDFKDLQDERTHAAFIKCVAPLHKELSHRKANCFLSVNWREKGSKVQCKSLQEVLNKK